MDKNKRPLNKDSKPKYIDVNALKTGLAELILWLGASAIIFAFGVSDFHIIYYKYRLKSGAYLSSIFSNKATINKRENAAKENK